MNIEKNALHILVDMENVQLRLPELAGLQRGRHHLQIFHGPSQNKLTIELVRALQPLGDAVEYIQCEKAGPNALDFHLAFHLGRLIALRPEAHYLIISRDRGFEQLVAHANRMGHQVMQRAALPVNLADPAALAGPAVGTGRATRAGSSTARTRPAPAAPAAAPDVTAVAAPPRKAAAVKSATKKTPARKVAAKKADKSGKVEKTEKTEKTAKVEPVEKAGKPTARRPAAAPAMTEQAAAPKHAPAKKASAKTAASAAAPAAKKAPARKAAGKQAAVAASAAAAPAASTRAVRDTANASDHHKAVAGLVKLGIKRPVTERALKHYLKSYLGNDLSDIAVQALVQHLVRSGELTLSQGKLSYHLSA